MDLEEIYLQQNQIHKIEGFENNLKLQTLDIAVNKITKFENLDHLKDFRELWANWNNIEDSDDNKNYMKTFTELKTIYLADNPIS